MSCPRPAGTSQPLPSEGTDAQVPVAVEQNSVAAHSAYAEQARVLGASVAPTGMNVHWWVIAESQY
jgi:hypothetical protein